MIHEEACHIYFFSTICDDWILPCVTMHGFCKKGRESTKHLFWECPHVQQFWKDVEQKITERNPLAKNFKVKENLILFGVEDGFVTDTICDLILLLGKFFINKCKVIILSILVFYL